MTEHQDCVSGVLRKKKDAGIPINDQAIAIAISECKSKKSMNSQNDMFQTFHIEYKVIELV